MADEFDRKYFPEAVQTAFAVSLGAAYTGFNAMITPMESIPKFVGEAKALIELPEDCVRSPQGIAEALAGNVMSKGVELMATFKMAGETFTEEAKK